MNATPVIQCRGVTVAYGRDVVLDRIDLTVPRGALLPFVGPNGAGKTTLLKACLGLIPHQGGEILCDFGGLPPAYVPQQKQIDPIYPVSVRDLVRMGLYPEIRCWGRFNCGRNARVARILTRFGLEEHQHKHFGELSGGLRQKALLARAVVTQASVLVLDEPTAGLDATSEADLLNLIRSLHEDEGKTVLWVHHRLDQCVALARQVCLVDKRGVRLTDCLEVAS
ncbi:MAG TPA: ATP-binding cassette domain-containing protein [Kiritimatiellia bacterium]|nr:MAG: putative siderophore transport system ATP-binding protein YusV [Verrucomicrobia bacterium ADurb.Bin070]HPO36445.1 ATP-binding cassette domain-containing protein [Kiritimatiellia bacterium]HQQ91529.1 ATP-binding cassette domain-containing protein [Kiritimatiellia bacterium]